ncbi:ATP-binding protein [Streptosporangium amethystogenes]|uniref:ATP-binding protein n=1 Tax=Streptosporangium amethystogenes TaxID=2002 RepID=UPI0037B38EFB
MRVSANKIPGREGLECWESCPYPILLRLRLTTAGLFAEVWDSNDGTPRGTAAGQDDESGRGLLLVGLCADEWGHYRSQTGGKVVFGRWILPSSWHRPAVRVPLASA